MREKLVAADSSPLIGLAIARAFDLPRELFGTVTITRAVRDEVMAGGKRPGARELDDAMRAGWIRVAPTPLDTWRFAQLGTGEASTIAFALAHPGALVLMDDVPGREQAEASGARVMDLAALLLAAKRGGVIRQVRPLLARLGRKGFVIGNDVVRGVLAEAGEE